MYTCDVVSSPHWFLVPIGFVLFFSLIFCVDSAIGLATASEFNRRDEFRLDSSIYKSSECFMVSRILQKTIFFQFSRHIFLKSNLNWRGSPWNLVSAHGVKKLEWSGYRVEREIWWYLQPSGYNTPTWWTHRNEMKWNEGNKGLRLEWRYHRRTVAEALYNLGSWLALTVVPWRKLVAAHSPR